MVQRARGVDRGWRGGCEPLQGRPRPARRLRQDSVIVSKQTSMIRTCDQIQHGFEFWDTMGKWLWLGRSCHLGPASRRMLTIHAPSLTEIGFSRSEEHTSELQSL